MSDRPHEESETFLLPIAELVARDDRGGLRFEHASDDDAAAVKLARDGVPPGVLSVWEHPAPSAGRLSACEDAWWVLDGAEWVGPVLRAAREDAALGSMAVPVCVLRAGEERVRDRCALLSGRPSRSVTPLRRLPLRRDSGTGTVEDVVEALRAQGFLGVAREHIVRCVTAILGEDQGVSQAMQEARELDAETLANCVDAIARAMVFLQQKVGLAHLALLPYGLHLVVLARFFALHRDPHPRSSLLLVRWFWRDVVANHEDRGAAMAIRRTQKCVGDDEHASVQALLQTGQHISPGPQHVWAAILGNRRLLATILASLGPRRLDDETPIDLEAHFAHPQRDWFTALEAPRVRGSALRTLFLHPRMSPAAFERVLVHAPASVLRSHVMPDEAVRELARGRRAAAISLRENALREDALEFINRRAAWDAQDRPPIDALRVDDGLP